jgi:hypothetical protein
MATPLLFVLLIKACLGPHIRAHDNHCEFDDKTVAASSGGPSNCPPAIGYQADGLFF